MTWNPIEATPPHRIYLILSIFLIYYALFSNFIRNRLHLSEPPLALVLGILLGPRCFDILSPNKRGVSRGGQGIDDDGGWGWGDDIVQEVTRVIVGIQVFATGIELPKYYMSRHWKSIAMLLGPVMSFGWIVSAVLAYWLFQVPFPAALCIGACLTPTDPVLSASILSNSQFSTRVPARLKHMLSAESGCNDGISFPFLYVGLAILTKSTAGASLKYWLLNTVLYQCAGGIAVGLTIGTVFNRVLRYCEKRDYISSSAFTSFYMLLALLSVGMGSLIGFDDFLVAFGAGYGFARDGWFSKKTHEAQLPQVVDLILNSSMFVYFGTILPWNHFTPHELTPHVTPVRLVVFFGLVLLLRRIPAVYALQKFIPDIRTPREALFCGHFGPMGLGGLFLAIEGRAVLETGTAEALPHPPAYEPPFTSRQIGAESIWPVISFVVFGSTLVHGLSVLALSVAGHFQRKEGERAPLLAAETEPLDGMAHEGGGGESEPESEIG